MLQALLRLAMLRRLGVFICALAMLLTAANIASALEPAQTKTRVWGFDFAEHNSAGLFRAASSGKHLGNRLAGAEEASGSLLAAEGAEARGVDIVGQAGHTGLQPTQLSVDRSIVQKYAKALNAGEKVDPIHAVEVPGGQRYIIEGHHRYVAGQLTGKPVDVVVQQGAGPVGFNWKDVIYEVFGP